MLNSHAVNGQGYSNGVARTANAFETRETTKLRIVAYVSTADRAPTLHDLKRKLGRDGMPDAASDAKTLLAELVASGKLDRVADLEKRTVRFALPSEAADKGASEDGPIPYRPTEPGQFVRHETLALCIEDITEASNALIGVACDTNDVEVAMRIVRGVRTIKENVALLGKVAQ